MIFIFGTKATHVATAQTDHTCGHCESQRSVFIHVFQRYFHLFWIPAFPLWKSGSSVCSHCKQTLEPKQFDAQMKESYKEIKKDSKAPWWTFFLLLLILTLVLISFLLNVFGNK